METFTLIGKIDSDGHLRLDVPTHLPPGKVELVLVVQSKPSLEANRYNFSDLLGKLSWQGDAVVEQRSLRNEW